MTCVNKNIKELLPVYLSRELDPEKRPTVENHLADCSDCTAELLLLRSLADESVPDPGVAFWNEMPGRIYRAAQQERAKKKRVDFSWLVDRFILPRWVFAAATAGVVLVTSLFLFHALQREPDSIVSQGDLYSDEIITPGSMNIAALNQDEMLTMDAWAVNELASIAQEAEPVMTSGRDMNLYEELAVLNTGEIESLSHMINEWEEEV
jgi:anti-sigma factor RsiW